MGQSYKECWASAWPAVGSPFEAAIAGETSLIVNERMFLDRNGYLEETFFTFSLSPIRDESGQVAGLFHPVTEMTDQTLAERRLQVVRDLADRAVEERTVEMRAGRWRRLSPSTNSTCLLPCSPRSIPATAVPGWRRRAVHRSPHTAITRGGLEPRSDRACGDKSRREYRQAHPPRTYHICSRAADGFGLGLSIARQAARVIGGNLEIEPATGGGTVARLILLLEVAQQTA